MNIDVHLKISFTLPVKILTKKIARNKTDSIFYSGKNIAEVKFLNREYVLTTAGEYRYSLKENDDNKYTDSSPVVKFLNDKRIQKLSNNGLQSNWGWFGINLWIDGKCQDVPTDAYSTYDEAMKAFISFVKKDVRQNLCQRIQ